MPGDTGLLVIRVADGERDWRLVARYLKSLERRPGVSVSALVDLPEGGAIAVAAAVRHALDTLPKEFPS